ncbi:uncharacterized protein LOC128205950 isoform X2 [Mya arenaria]|uniref:uncharacterized protein LOC128205950 isoform X2 n=1 Tax=Mya arenaria TaxID=6604 RepID=UPI0022E55FF8|nr:uncharacterized protein LOC128205950 isoform X2 [Mya arenaria]
MQLYLKMFLIQQFTKCIVLISLWTSYLTAEDFYCPDIPNLNKSRLERVNYTQYDLVKEGVFVASAKQILFKTKGKHNAHILLQKEPEDFLTNVYEVVLGADRNTISYLRLHQHGQRLDALKTSGILNETEYRSFWITWNSILAIGQGTRIDINSIILLTRLDFPINSMRISYGWGSDGFFRFHDKSDNATSPRTTTPRRETSDHQSTQKALSDSLQDKHSSIVIALATSTGCLGFILLSTLLGVCFLWNKRKATGMGTHSQANPVGGEHYEGLRGREQNSVYQHYATLSV